MQASLSTCQGAEAAAIVTDVLANAMTSAFAPATAGRDFSRDDIHNLRKAYRLIFAEEGTMSERLQDVAEIFLDNQAVMEIVNFIQADSSRAICQPKMEDAA